MKRHSFLIALGLLPSLVALVLLLLVARATLHGWVSEQRRDDHRSLVTSLASDVGARLQHSQAQLRLAALGQDFAGLPLLDAIDRSVNGLPQAMEPGKRRIMELLRQQAGFSVVFVLTPQGDHYISHPFEVQKGLKKYNLADRPYFQQAAQTRSGVVSAPFVGADGLAAVAMDEPVLDGQGGVVLHLGGVVHLQALQALLSPEHIAPFEYAVLADAQGHVLALSSADGPHSVPAHLVQAVQAKTSSAAPDPERLLDRGSEGRWWAYSAPVAFGWTLHALRSEAGLLSEVDPAMARLTVYAMLSLLAPALLGLGLALRYKRFAEKSERALQETNQQLESRVQERTAELERSVVRHRTLFECAADAVLILDGDRIADCNPAALGLFGVGQIDQLVGRRPEDLSPMFQADGTPSEVRRQQLRLELQASPQGSLYFEWQHHRLDTLARFSAIVRLSLMRLDGRTLVQANIRDISERMRAQEDLRIAATVFESHEGMTVTDAANRILRVNRAFTRITGYESNEVVGQTPKVLQSGRHDRSFYQAMFATLHREGVWQGEVWNRRKSGEIYPQLLTISVVRDGLQRISHYVAVFMDISARKAAESQIEILAFYDPLTRLANRRLLRDRMAQAQHTSARTLRHHALLYVDLDEFKILNDSQGHPVGDELLEQVAQRLRQCVREGDTAARLGADEFVLMLEDLSKNPIEAAQQAESVAEKIHRSLAEPYVLGAGSQHCTGSIGVTVFGGGSPAQDDPLKCAELAMFQAKQSGRNTTRFFEPRMQEAVSQRAAMETALRQAIEQGQLLLHYQVQVNAQGAAVGVEALVRWQHPTRGMVAPGEFIGLAEETGLILPLGQWVLEQACAQLAAWEHEAPMRSLCVAVNVSARQFHHRDFVGMVQHAVERSGADPCRLKLELTESMLVHDLGAVIAKMGQLKTLGVGFSLDDFGTGYSSLAYLKQLPLDQLKIDQGFVRDILTDPNDAAIAKMVVSLANDLGLSVIAEGVETQAQRECLARLGCHTYQGYLFGKPVPVDALPAYLQHPLA